MREGDTLIVTKLDRLARSVPDARAIGDDLAARRIKLSLEGQVYDPIDPMGKTGKHRSSSDASWSAPTGRWNSEGMSQGRAGPALGRRYGPNSSL